MERWARCEGERGQTRLLYIPEGLPRVWVESLHPLKSTLTPHGMHSRFVILFNPTRYNRGAVVTHASYLSDIGGPTLS